MTMYSYEAQTMHGGIKKGNLKAENTYEAKQTLKKKGLRSTLLIEREETFATKDLELFTKISTKRLAEYLQKFSTLINSGVTITMACEMLSSQEKNKNLKNILQQISEDIRGGDSLSNCYSKHPNAFTVMLVSIIRASEMSGTLDETLNRMSTYYEKQAKSKSGVITSRIYPIILLIISLCVGIFLVVVIVPQFITVFESFGADLPLITKMTIKFSDFMKTKGLVLLITFIKKI